MKLHIVLKLVLSNLHSSSLPALPHTLHLCPEYSESEVFGKENQIFIIKVPHTLHFCPEYSKSEVFDKKNYIFIIKVPHFIVQCILGRNPEFISKYLKSGMFDNKYVHCSIN